MVLEGRGCHGVSSAGCEPVTRVRVHVTPPKPKGAVNNGLRGVNGCHRDCQGFTPRYRLRKF